MGKKICFQNAYIIDGIKSEGFIGNVYIEKDKIKEVTTKTKDDFSGEVIDCSGLILTPGWIDAHTHNDFFLNRSDDVKFFAPFALQGVTTLVTGNCGFSPFGYKKDTSFLDKIGGGLFKVYPKDTIMHDFVTWKKETTRVPLNLVPLVGHGTARIGVNGKLANPLTAEQQKQMLESIEENLKQGAYGVSLGLMYEPGMYAPYEELVEVAKLVHKYDRILTVHNRAQSKISTSYSPPIGGRAHNLRALDEMIQLARETRVRLQNSHLIYVGEKTIQTYDESMKLIQKAVEEGLDFGFDLFSLTYGASIITVILPGWYLKLSKKKRNNFFVKLRLWVEIHVAKSALGLDFSDIKIANGAGKIDAYQGEYIDQIAKKLHMRPYKAYIEMVNKSEGRAGVYIKKYSTDNIITTLMKHPKSLLMTDAWVQSHGVQNGAAFFGMVKFALMHKEAKMQLEEVIQKMTSLTAERFNIQKRGKVQAGYFADLTIFDPNMLSYDETSLQVKGMKYVYVNGSCIVENDTLLEDAFMDSGEILSL